MTFGLGADTDHSYPSQLARLPDIQALDLKIVNLGRAGQTMHDAIRDVDTYLKRKSLPNTVVLLLGGFNDCVNLPGMLSGDQPQPENVRPVRDLLVRTRTYRLLAQILARLRPHAELEKTLLPPPGTGQDVELCRNQLTELGVDAAARLSHQFGFHLLVTTYPVPLHAPNSELPRVTSQVNALLREEVNKRDILLLDIEECVQKAEKASNEPFYNDDGIHLFPVGYGAMARCLADRLVPLLRGA